MAAVDADARALVGLERARSFAILHSERYQELLKDDPSTTVEGCFPPESGAGSISMPDAQTWEFLDALTRLHEELAALDVVDPLRIFRVRDRPLYDSLAARTEQLEQIRGLADYLLLPKALVLAIEAHTTVEACKQEYVEALTKYEHSIDTATESRPRLLLSMLLHPCLRDLADIAIDKLSRDAQDGKGDRLWSEILESVTLGKLTCLKRAILDGLMGEPIMGEWLDDDYQDFPDPLNLALALNRVGALDGMAAHGVDFSKPWSEVVKRAVEYGHVDILERIRTLAPKAFDVARHSARVKALKTAWLAVEQGRKAACRWIIETLKLEEHFPSDSRLMECAAFIGDLDMVKRLHAGGTGFLPDEMLIHACHSLDMTMAQWALESGATWGQSWPFDDSLRPEHMGFVMWALEKGCSPRAFYFDDFRGVFSVCQGEVQLLESLKERGLSIDHFGASVLAQEAVSAGRLDLLEWAAAQPQARFCDPFLDGEGFKVVLESAMDSNQPACFDWMMARLREALLKHSGRKLHPEKWPYYAPMANRKFLEQLLPFYDMSSFYTAALWDPDLDTARWLFARGVKLTSEVVADICAAGEHALPLLRFCVEEAGFDIRSEPSITEHVADGGSVAMMEYVRSKGCEWDDAALLSAATNGALPMLRWLRSQRMGLPWPDGLVAHSRRWKEDETAAWAEAHGAPS